MHKTALGKPISLVNVGEVETVNGDNNDNEVEEVSPLVWNLGIHSIKLRPPKDGLSLVVSLSLLRFFYARSCCTRLVANGKGLTDAVC